MLNIIPTDQEIELFKNSLIIYNSTNPFMKYNYIIDLINYSKTSDPNHKLLEPFSNFSIQLYSISIRLQILLTALILISCTIPATNVLSIVILLITLITILMKHRLLSRNNQKSTSSFSLMCEYDDLCFDLHGDKIASQKFYIPFNQFANEDLGSVLYLKGMNDISHDQNLEFIAYRSDIQN